MSSIIHFRHYKFTDIFVLLYFFSTSARYCLFVLYVKFLLNDSCSTNSRLFNQFNQIWTRFSSVAQIWHLNPQFDPTCLLEGVIISLLVGDNLYSYVSRASYDQASTAFLNYFFIINYKVLFWKKYIFNNFSQFRICTCCKCISPGSTGLWSKWDRVLQVVVHRPGRMSLCSLIWSVIK